MMVYDHTELARRIEEYGNEYVYSTDYIVWQFLREKEDEHEVSTL